MFKKYKKWLIFLFILFLTVFAINWWYKFNLNNPFNPENDKRILFTIKTGDTSKQIGENLEKKGVIRSSLVFYLYTRFNHIDKDIKAGKFVLYANKTLTETTQIITRQGKGEEVIVVPEGYTVKNIDDMLSSLDFIEKGELLILNPSDFDYPFLKNAKSLEGYLFPDTYYIDPSNFNLKSFVDRLLSNFSKKFDKDLEQSLKISGKSIKDVIIMASIIEKEIKKMEDKKIVSGIFWKRLENNWTLGADATLLYQKSTHSITNSDLLSDSPYNTRKNRGLPPTPICNPGLDSIIASLSPKTTKYWYYLTPLNSDKVIYAVTNDEQNVNKEKYL